MSSLLMNAWCGSVVFWRGLKHFIASYLKPLNKTSTDEGCIPSSVEVRQCKYNTEVQYG